VSDGTAVEGAATRAREPAAGTGFLAEVWINFKRWNLKAIRNPFVVAGSIIQPIIFLVLFTQVFGGVASAAINQGPGPSINYTSFLVPAIVIQVSLVAAATSGIGLVNDIEEGMFEKVLVSPMRRTAVFAGKTLAELARIAVQVTIILVLGVLLGAHIATGLLGAITIMAVGMVFSLWFTGFSNVMALLTRDQESTIIAANIIQFPLLFVSSAFLPIAALPDWIQTISKLNPITYGVDAARALVVQGWVWHVVLRNLAVLVALDLVFGAVAVYFLNRASSAAVE